MSWEGNNNDQFQYQGNQYQGYQGKEQQGFASHVIPSQGFQQQGQILSSISSLENMMKQFIQHQGKINDDQERINA